MEWDQRDNGLSTSVYSVKNQHLVLVSLHVSQRPEMFLLNSFSFSTDTASASVALVLWNKSVKNVENDALSLSALSLFLSLCIFLAKKDANQNCHKKIKETKHCAEHCRRSTEQQPATTNKRSGIA